MDDMVRWRERRERRSEEKEGGKREAGGREGSGEGGKVALVCVSPGLHFPSCPALLSP